MATTDKVEQDISPGPDWVGSLSTMPAWEAILIGVRTTVGRGPGKGPLFHGETLKGYLPRLTEIENKLRLRQDLYLGKNLDMDPTCWNSSIIFIHSINSYFT